MWSRCCQRSLLCYILRPSKWAAWLPALYRTVLLTSVPIDNGGGDGAMTMFQACCPCPRPPSCSWSPVHVLTLELVLDIHCYCCAFVCARLRSVRHLLLDISKRCSLV